MRAPEVTIQNVVASASINQNVDLKAIERTFKGTLNNVEYRPKRFPGLVFRLKRPKTATLIFTSGKMVCTGAKSENDARKAVKKVVKMLKKNGIIILGKPTIRIQNIVASGDLHGEIDIERVLSKLKHVIYEPEQFPGLIYSMESPDVVFLLFASGKIVCTGAKSTSMVYEAVDTLKRQLEKKRLIRY